MDLNNKKIVFENGLKKLDHCHNMQISCDSLDELKISNIEQILLDKASNMTSHHQDLVNRAARKVSKNDLKIADTIKLHNCRTVYVGNQVSVREQIVLKNETGPKLHKSETFQRERMVERQFWLARSQVSKPIPLRNPVKYVIIAHTATDQYQTHIENVAAMQIIQKFHMESMGWEDVGYNFCIGSDGNAYEGRGWFHQGSHTLGYNTCSLGIAFIGCFLSVLPPKFSLDRCKELIREGVKIGAIREDYELIAQCQCRPFLSPGLRLYEELSSWEHFNPNIRNTDTCSYS